MMSLPSPQPRKKQHCRSITFEGYEREDGLWDIEGHLVDTKTYSFPNDDRGEIKAGEPVHDLWIRLSIDDDLLIHKVEVAMAATPFHYCCEIADDFKKLEGLVIGPGWNRKVRELLGGVRGCTHIVEMLPGIATAAFQSLYPTLKKKREKAEDVAGRKPSQIDGCHALKSDGLIVKSRWPEFYTGE